MGFKPKANKTCNILEGCPNCPTTSCGVQVKSRRQPRVSNVMVPSSDTVTGSMYRLSICDVCEEDTPGGVLIVIG